MLPHGFRALLSLPLKPGFALSERLLGARYVFTFNVPGMKRAKHPGFVPPQLDQGLNGRTTASRAFDAAPDASGRVSVGANTISTSCLMTL